MNEFTENYSKYSIEAIKEANEFIEKVKVYTQVKIYQPLLLDIYRQY